jgi:pilin isopeptide linkage protein
MDGGEAQPFDPGTPITENLDLHCICRAIEPDVPRGIKTATGAMLPANLFEFGLFNGETLLATGTNDARGNIAIDYQFEEEGTYNLTMRELTPEEMASGALGTDGRGWVMGGGEFPVTVTVGAGPSITNITYPEGEPEFTNSFEPENCGLIQFPDLTFTGPGAHEYTIKETSGATGGWTPDVREHNVIITVTDDGEGNLIPTLEYPGGFPEFENRFEYSPACVIISANKVAIGAPLVCGMFVFSLFDSDGNLVSTTTNQQPGSKLPTPCTSW